MNSKIKNFIECHIIYMYNKLKFNLDNVFVFYIQSLKKLIFNVTYDFNHTDHACQQFAVGYV